MKRIATQENSIQKRILINIPFVLIVALIIACLSGGALLLFYSIVSIFAFNSAMICLIMMGASLILISAGLGFIVLYKKYYAFYNKKMGWILQEAKPQEEKTSTQNQKKSFKDYITLPNVCFAILAVGALFTILSAVFGSTDRDKWVQEISSFREYNGYYQDVKTIRTQYPINANGTTLNKIELDLIDKIGVVIYTDDKDKQGFVIVEGYTKYQNHLVLSKYDQSLAIKENPSPKRNETLDKLLFFVFDDFSVEKQVLIYIPADYKDNIVIEGENVIYPDIEEETKH